MRQSEHAINQCMEIGNSLEKRTVNVTRAMARISAYATASEIAYRASQHMHSQKLTPNVPFFDRNIEEDKKPDLRVVSVEGNKIAQDKDTLELVPAKQAKSRKRA